MGAKKMSSCDSKHPQHLYCFGGYTKHWLPVVNVSCMDLARKQWDTITKMPQNRSNFGGAVVGTKIYLAGGVTNNRQALTSMDMYDCSTKTWKPLASMPEHRNNFGMAALNGYIYVTGGSDKPGGASLNDRLDTCFRYCIDTNKWEEIPCLNIPRMSHQLIELDGYLYAIGGLHWEDAPTVERYDPKTNRWRFIPNSNLKYCEPGATVHNGKIYVCSHEAFEVYDPKDESWTILKPPTEFNKNNRVLVSANGKLLSLGGCGNSVFKKTIIEYSVADDSWRRAKAMDIERDGHCGFVVPFLL